MSSPNIHEIVEYLSDEFRASQGDDDDDNTTLESISEDDSDTEGSLKDFVVSDEEDGEYEEDQYPYAEKKVSINKEIPDGDGSILVKEGIDEKNIITGKRNRKPAERYCPEDDAMYKVLLLGDVDLEHYHDTENKDLEKINEDDTDSYEPEEEDNDYMDVDEYADEEEEEEEDEEDDEEDVEHIRMVSKVLPVPSPKKSDTKPTGNSGSGPSQKK